MIIKTTRDALELAIKETAERFAGNIEYRNGPEPITTPYAFKPRTALTEDDSEPTPMTYERARALVGNQPTFALRNMVRALDLLPYLNTDADRERQVAARVILESRKHRKGNR